jgi:hypothetical protein
MNQAGSKLACARHLGTAARRVNTLHGFAMPQWPKPRETIRRISFFNIID